MKENKTKSKKSTKPNPETNKPLPTTHFVEYKAVMALKLEKREGKILYFPAPSPFIHYSLAVLSIYFY